MSDQTSSTIIRRRLATVTDLRGASLDAYTTAPTRLAQKPSPRLEHLLRIRSTPDELRMAELIDRFRPPSLRIFDQIPMRSHDHVRQAKLIAPYLADQSVAFMGDSDCTSLLLGLLSKCGRPLPSRMLILDFDARLLRVAVDVAKAYGFSHVLEARLYNAFDALPGDLVSQFDWFYTNPPYGSHNLGESARLFITRGCELVRPGGQGCIILPHDRQRPWTQAAMWETQSFLTQHAWAVNDKVRGLHRYRLDDDRYLTSSLMLVENVEGVPCQSMPYSDRRVAYDEIPLFYGRGVMPPYPRYICHDGSVDEDWIMPEVYIDA